MTKRTKRDEPVDLPEIWRAFMGMTPAEHGPAEPPMIRWLRLGRPKDAWEREADERFAMGVKRWQEEGPKGQLDLFGID